MTALEWMDDAACAGMDERVFFDAADGYAEALATCNTCPAREACLQYALTHGIDHGVFGGTIDKDRAKQRLRSGMLRTRGRKPVNAGHGGSYMYQRRKCRCDECRAWNSRNNAAYKAARKARLKAEPEATRARKAS